MSSPILLAVLAGTAAATWTICVKFGSTNITAALGAMTITGAAFVVNALALVIMRAGGIALILSGMLLLQAQGG